LLRKAAQVGLVMKVVVKLEKGGKVVAQSKDVQILRQQDIEVSLFDEDVCVKFSKTDE
jgi:hypothetical protein